VPKFVVFFKKKKKVVNLNFFFNAVDDILFTHRFFIIFGNKKITVQVIGS